MDYKLGLKPHISDERDIPLTAVYSKPSALPSDFGVTGLPWGMLGNDAFGDCYWASAAHEVMAQAHLAGRNPAFDFEGVLSSYAEYLGLAPDELTEANDAGTGIHDGAKFRRQRGVKDVYGHGHRIGAYVFIEVPDYELIKSAVYDFSGVTVCVELPESAVNAGVWDYVKGSPILGGHAIAGVCVKQGALYVVSWGAEVEVTPAFLEKYLQCVVVYISGSTLNKEGKTVNGLDVTALREKLAALNA
jgi:hypothetical protein